MAREESERRSERARRRDSRGGERRRAGNIVGGRVERRELAIVLIYSMSQILPFLSEHSDA